MGEFKRNKEESKEMTYFAESIKGTVEEDKNCSTGHLGDVVQRLTGIVAYPGIWVIETCQNWLHQLR